MADIVMPVLGPEMNEGRVLRWLKKAGDIVHEGEAILEVEGDKTTIEITAPASGALAVFAQEGISVPVRQVIARIDDGCAQPAPAAASSLQAVRNGPTAFSAVGQPSAAPSSEVRASPRARRIAADRGIELSGVVGTGPNGMISERDVLVAAERLPAPGELSGQARVSNLARKLADQLGVDLTKVTPTGVGGRIMEEDVRRAAEVAAASAATAGSSAVASAFSPSAAAPATMVGDPGEIVPLTPARRVTAERMAASWHAAPRVTLYVQVDMRRAVRFREELNADWAPDGVRISVDALLVRAVALSLTAHPQMNARWEEGTGVRQFKTISVGVAVDTDRGLLVPVLKNVGDTPLDDIARQLATLASQARVGTLTSEEMAGGTFTITNLGTRGVDAFSPVVNPPQAGILAAGRIAKRPWVDGDTLCVAETMTLSLAFDHRVVDGGPAADFLATIRDNLEHPFRLLGQAPR